MPRLYLAKNLLRQDGVIFISIDDNEVHNLRLLCNEIFGEENFIASLARKTKLTSNKGTFFAPSHEYILCYAKNILNSDGFCDVEAQEEEQYLKLFKYEDEYSKYNIVGLYQPSLDQRINQRYYIKCPDGSYVIPPGSTFPSKISDGSFIAPNSANDKVWRWSYESYLKADKHKLVFIETKTSPLLNEYGKQSKWNVYTKIYLKDRLEDGLRPTTLITKYPNSEASKELIKFNIPFDFSKPKKLIKYLIKIIGCDDNDIILDFFAGSGTTAHAVMELNKEDGGSRKYICVQLPEPCEEGSEAYKAGYGTIADICKERIKRASKKIATEIVEQQHQKANSPELINGDDAEQANQQNPIDLGCKFFKLSDSNFKQWQHTTAIDADTLATQIELFIDPISEQATITNMVYEFLLKSGLELNSNIMNHNGYFSINDNELMLLLKEVTPDIIERVINSQPKPQKVIALDRLFNKDDQLKTNTVLQMQDADIEFKTV